MSSWWVNHKQTHDYEINDGFIWSPKTEKNGSFSQFYLNLTLVKPGELIFSYAESKIKAIGIATAGYTQQTKPQEFYAKSENWNAIGWIVPVEWVVLNQPFSPKAYIDEISPLLPVKYSPINNRGNGNQKCYLAEISNDLSHFLISKARDSNEFIQEELNELNSHIMLNQKIEEIVRSDINQTVKEQLIKARLGQGKFKKNLLKIEAQCRLTGVSNPMFLIASHIKPWSQSDNRERLDGNNGLLLSPQADWLFDRGWISFQDNGDILVSTYASQIMSAWNLNKIKNAGIFSPEQKLYLKYHRENVFKSF